MFWKVPPNLAQYRRCLLENSKLSDGDLGMWERSPRLRNLKDILYRKSSKALELFKSKDANHDGHLSIKEVSKICSDLEPQLTVRPHEMFPPGRICTFLSSMDSKLIWFFFGSGGRACNVASENGHGRRWIYLLQRFPQGHRHTPPSTYSLPATLELKSRDTSWKNPPQRFLLLQGRQAQIQMPLLLYLSSPPKIFLVAEPFKNKKSQWG